MAYMADRTVKPFFLPICDFLFIFFIYRATFMGAARLSLWQSHTSFWYWVSFEVWGFEAGKEEMHANRLLFYGSKYQDF